MLQVPIEILILDEENKDHLNKAIGILHKIQNTFKYSILKNIELEHKIHSDVIVKKIDVYDYSDKYKSIVKGYHPHLICVINKYIIGEELSNLFASLERKNGNLTGNGVITSYQVKDLIENIPMPIYFMFYLIINPLRYILKERIGHREARVCIYDTKVNKKDIYKILKYGTFCLECNDKIRSVLSIQEMKSVRETIGFISDVANSSNPNQFYSETLLNYKVETNDLDASNDQDLDDAISLLKKSRIEDAFDKVSLLIKRKYPDLYHEIIGLFSRLNKLKYEKRMGILSRENEQLESNSINHSFLELINEIKKKNN